MFRFRMICADDAEEDFWEEEDEAEWEDAFSEDPFWVDEDDEDEDEDEREWCD